STIQKIVSLLLCLAVMAGIFSVASSAFVIPQTAVQAEKTEEPADEEQVPDTKMTIFGLWEVSPAMANLLDRFPVLLVIMTPFLMFYEIPYVVKDIFTRMFDRD
ncbi:MAG: hypothetical protein IKS04_01950, partial [Clostridia bacterium]|nr:hypothetical protein [Clostridia bacterium]